MLTAGEKPDIILREPQKYSLERIRICVSHNAKSPLLRVVRCGAASRTAPNPPDFTIDDPFKGKKREKLGSDCPALIPENEHMARLF